MRAGQCIWRTLIGLMFILAGVYHFRRPDLYLAIMPPYLPWHSQLVALSGSVEIVLGALVLFPRFRRRAGWGLIALLVAVFPANVYMALHTDHYPGIPAWLLWLRLPLQGVFIAWVHRCTQASSDPLAHKPA